MTFLCDKVSSRNKLKKDCFWLAVLESLAHGCALGVLGQSIMLMETNGRMAFLPRGGRGAERREEAKDKTLPRNLCDLLLPARPLHQNSQTLSKQHQQPETMRHSYSVHTTSATKALLSFPTRWKLHESRTWAVLPVLRVSMACGIVRVKLIYSLSNETGLCG